MKIKTEVKRSSNAAAVGSLSFSAEIAVQYFSFFNPNADWIGMLDDSGRPLSACDGCFAELNNKQNKILNETLWCFRFYPSPINLQGEE